MAQERTYVEFSPEEALCGAEYARTKYQIDLSADFLRDLGNKTRSLMESDFRSFRDARFQVLNGARLMARTADEKAKRKAYEGALGKMFNRRKQYAKTSKTPAPQSAPNISQNKNGQFEFIL